MCHFWGEVLKGPCACSACALLQGPWRSLKDSRQVPKPSHMCVTSKPSEPQAAAISETVAAVGAATPTPLERRFLMPRPRPSPTNTGMVRFQGQRPGHGLSEPHRGHAVGMEASATRLQDSSVCPQGRALNLTEVGALAGGGVMKDVHMAEAGSINHGRFLPTVL